MNRYQSRIKRFYKQEKKELIVISNISHCTVYWKKKNIYVRKRNRVMNIHCDHSFLMYEIDIRKRKKALLEEYSYPYVEQMSSGDTRVFTFRQKQMREWKKKKKKEVYIYTRPYMVTASAEKTEEREKKKYFSIPDTCHSPEYSLIRHILVFKKIYEHL